jgi:predicted membrane protein
MMHEIIHPRTAKKHLYIHIATLITFILSLFVNTFIFLAAVLTILSFSWMAYQIIHAQKLYKETQKNGKKFNMGNMK